MYKNNRKNNCIIAVLFVCVLVLAVFVTAACTNGFTNANLYGWFDKKAEQPAEPDGDLEIVEMSSSSFVRLLAGATTFVGDSVSKTIYATVLPIDAPNKEVDWTLYWADDAALNNQPIGNYLTLTPASDGATTATITCTQSFRGSVAYVKVTTRVGRYEAVCAVRFVGEPYTVKLDTSSYTNKDTGVNSFQYLIPVYTQNAIPIDLANAFGDVGDEFYTGYTVEVTGIGKIKVQDYYSTTGWSGSESEVSLDSIKNQLIQASIQNNQLILRAGLIENYSETSQSMGGNGVFYSNKFKSYVANSAGSPGVTPYFRVVVQASSGLAAEFCCRFVSSVSSVSTASEVTF